MEQALALGIVQPEVANDAADAPISLAEFRERQVARVAHGPLLAAAGGSTTNSARKDANPT